VRLFAEQAGLRLLEINLEQHRRLEPVFASLNVGRILLELEAIAGRSTGAAKSLLFLDEVQATPSALAALRYLHDERPELPIVAAGSLLEMVLRSHDFSMPVGRIEYLHLGPLTFEEFLGAVGEQHLLGLLGGWRTGQPWAREAHDKLLGRQREFLAVGGMPEAVSEGEQELARGARHGVAQPRWQV